MKVLTLGVDTCGTAKKPEPPKPISWNVYKSRQQSRLAWRGRGPDKAAAIETAAAEFKVPATKMMAIRR